jgi:hypothetical protein
LLRYCPRRRKNCRKPSDSRPGKLSSQVSCSEGVEWDLVRSGSRIGKVVKIRRIFCQMAVKRFGYSGAEVARHLGASTSSVTRLANSPELPELRRPEYAI